ncbi:MAG TPA: PTS fructose transporter subunit IIA [Candidatus Riflebacteria bacterium]|jgi:fructose-specific phosphotransferase system IIA component|nr:MAG: PTS fructose transporter subunit IIA [Candidatus Riflebacteria bacterium HGW-Riflebacteria-1]HAE39814.1 PTS fructose transporter subunit IIA [Candidatus Riflebacteria bacterium]
MQLVDVLKENLVFLNFEAENKDQAIEKFILSLQKTGAIKEPAALKDALFEREKLGTTGVGGGIAMPHARSSAIKDLTVAFFRSEDGIDFKAIDNNPVNIIFMLLAPVSSGGPYLKLLAKISRLLRSDDFKNSLLEAKDAAAVMQIIQEND